MIMAEHCSCSCSDWAACDINRGRFAIHCFGTMLKVEGLEKRLGLGLARSRSCLVAKIRRLGLVVLQEGLGLSLAWDQKPNVSVSSRSRKLRSRLYLWLLLIILQTVTVNQSISQEFSF